MRSDHRSEWVTTTNTGRQLRPTNDSIVEMRKIDNSFADKLLRLLMCDQTSFSSRLSLHSDKCSSNEKLFFCNGSNYFAIKYSHESNHSFEITLMQSSLTSQTSHISAPNQSQSSPHLFMETRGQPTGKYHLQARWPTGIASYYMLQFCQEMLSGL